MLALELNDARLLLATDDAASAGEHAPHIVASAPGIACITTAGVLVGVAAAAQARLQPQRIHSRHWRELSTAPLGRAPRPELCAADLAFEQLRALRAECGKDSSDDSRWLIAVPAGYSRGQLGLLLGVATEAGATEIGLVDAALAACALARMPRHVLHLELQRHCAILTAIEQTEGGASRARYEIDEHCGAQRLEQLCLDSVAAQFVRQTRFDPLHQARSEQLLADAVPRLLGALLAADTAPMSLEGGGVLLTVELTRAQWLAAAEGVYGALLQLLQRARPAGQTVELRVGARAQAFPGLVERLQTLKSCVLTLLPEGAAAYGALLHATAIFRGGEPALVCVLPLAHLSDEGEPAAVAAPPSTHATATHLLHSGRAWPLSTAPLTIGTQVPAEVRALLLPAGTPGISRVHCRVQVQDGVVLVEDLSTFGSFINEERVHGSATLQRGDRLRLGTPGLILDAIEVVSA
jgi:FHA domain